MRFSCAETRSGRLYKYAETVDALRSATIVDMASDLVTLGAISVAMILVTKIAAAQARAHGRIAASVPPATGAQKADQVQG